MILQNKNILIFAATGAISGGVARKCAAEGAHVCLSGNDPERLDALANEIIQAGGKTSTSIVDALDEQAVANYVQHVFATEGRIDGVFNGIGGRPATLGYPQDSLTQPLNEFMLPLERIVQSQFLSARVVGKHLVEQGSGSIVTLSATLSGMTASYMAGISAACGAIEAMTRALAGEFGPSGVRVNCVRGSAMPETRTIQETTAGQMELLDQASQRVMPPLGRPITVEETAGAAAFLFSDHASGMTGQIVTVCAGQFVG